MAAPGGRALRRGDTLVFATHNKGKIREVDEMMAPFGLRVVSAAALGLPEPEETGTTFEANALLKAIAAATASGHPTLADDSGLEVDALGGDPGIYSARWAGPAKDFGAAMQKIEDLLQAKGATTPEARHARFVAVLCLAFPDGAHETWRGTVEGHLVWPPRGPNGFGYDPMFVPHQQEAGRAGGATGIKQQEAGSAEGATGTRQEARSAGGATGAGQEPRSGAAATVNEKTFGEMEERDKHAISHRGRAFAAFAHARLK